MISVEEAREILGEENYSNEEIQEMLDLLYYLSEKILDNEV